MTTLEIKGVHASAAGVEILHGIDLAVSSGEVHVLMGPNGSGKSTLSHVIMGRPGYEVTAGEITLDGVDVLQLAPWERAQAGLFIALQYPTEVPGVRLHDVISEAFSAAGARHGRYCLNDRGGGRKDRLRRRVPYAVAQRRPVWWREEAKRDASAWCHQAANSNSGRARLWSRCGCASYLCPTGSSR